MPKLRALLQHALGRSAPDPIEYWEQRVARFEQENRRLAGGQDDQWVLLGDSLTENFPSALLWAIDRRFVNRGINGDVLDDGHGGGMLERLDPARLAPRASRIVVLAGINDLGEHPTEPELVLERYERLLGELRRRHPQAALTALSLLPVRPPHHYLRGSLKRFNDGLPEVAARHGAQPFDVHTPLTDSTGNLARHYATDGLHLTQLAYVRLALSLRELKSTWEATAAA